MVNELINVLYGAVIWQIWKLRFAINQKKVVLVLTGENQKVDESALNHLNDFMNRKYADGAIIIIDCKKMSQLIKKTALPSCVKVYQCSRNTIKFLYRYYSFYKCSDKLVFTYTDQPKDNQLGRVLRETLINEEEAVCLGLYRLRKIPEKKKSKEKRKE